MQTEISKVKIRLISGGHIVKPNRSLDEGIGKSKRLVAKGYTEEHILALVEGALPQHRVPKLSPRPADAENLTKLFQDAKLAW